MKVAVKDANVLIDMAEADLLGLWFSLAIPTHTTDLVLDEVEQTGQRAQIVPFVSDNQLHIHSVTSADMIKTAILANDHGISPADASALLLSKRLKAVLLTGEAVYERLPVFRPSRLVVYCGYLTTSWRKASSQVMMPRAN